CSGNHSTHGFGGNNPIWALYNDTVGQADIKRLKCVAQFLLARQQIHVLTHYATSNNWTKLSSRYVALKMTIVNKIVWCQFPQIGIDILGGLLATYAKTVTDVVCGQPTFPQGNSL